MSTQILAKGTGAANSSDFAVDDPEKPVTVSIYPEANFGADTGALTYKNPDGTYDAVFKDGTAVTLSATAPQHVVLAVGTYRLEFSARTAAIGAVIDA